MKITTKCSADVTSFLIKKNQSHDGREASVDLEIGVDQDNAAKGFGDEFESLAFATMMAATNNEGETKVVFLQDTIKPGQRIVCENHIVKIEEHEIKGQPQLMSIKTVDGAPRVVAKIRLPVDVSERKLVAMLTREVGKVIDVEFSPLQLPLPGIDENANAKED